MTKSIIVLLFIILALLLGCRFQSASFTKTGSGHPDSSFGKSDVRENLSELEETFSNFDYTSVIDEQSEIIPEGMSITKFRYFVIFSDLGDELTYKLIDSDIRNTIDAMTKNYVNKLPGVITPVYLFKDFDKYNQFVIDNYDIPENDISPYGFYKISKNVIIIRYVSWKGSVLHEITHKFIKRDFPDAPSWFDEGFAALNEKSTFKNDKLVGDFSLRIIPLRRAIKENTYTDLNHLMKTNDAELYYNKTSYYYAQARYLLMFLQEKELFEKYYKYFRDTYNTDKTGITQLEEVYGKPMETIENEYLDYINSFKE